jgi:hypothetical protein
MDILLPAGHKPPRTTPWGVIGAAMLVPPLVLWAALAAHQLHVGAGPSDLLYQRVPVALRWAGMAGCPVVATAMGFAVWRRAATQAAKVLARVVVVCGAALLVLAVLAALRPI